MRYWSWLKYLYLTRHRPRYKVGDILQHRENGEFIQLVDSFAAPFIKLEPGDMKVAYKYRVGDSEFSIGSEGLDFSYRKVQ
jgi:hypothetical protein